MRSPSHALWLPFLVLLLSLYATFELWKDARHAAENVLQANFSFHVRESTRRIEARMRAYEQVLRGVRGLFQASAEVTREEFRAYVGTLALNENYPGIEGVGFSLLVPADEKERHVAAVRGEGFPGYDIKPPGNRPFYTSIIYLEPFAGRNLRAFGYDMYSETVRRTAMEAARDSGMAFISGKVTLVQETGEDVQHGFLMYLPVYRRGMPADTVAERRSRLLGWVYAPFRMNDLMRGVLGEHADDLDIEIYDGETPGDATRMYDSAEQKPALTAGMPLTHVERIDIAGRRWTVAFSALPNFEHRLDYDKSVLVMRGGISISLLLSLICYLLIDERGRALQAAQQAMRLALYDVLTGLPNRKLVTERLHQALTAAKREKTELALMFIDLDRFKPVNDDFGHSIGDLLLKEVAHRLQQCMREMDTAARLGGDEFLALLPRVEGRNGALTVAAKILQALNQPFEIAGNSFSISGSIGIALYPEHGSDEKSLLRNADTAMYQAKKNGRNGISFFETGMAVERD